MSDANTGREFIMFHPQFVHYTPECGLRLLIPRNLKLLQAKQVEVLKGHDKCIHILGVSHALCNRTSELTIHSLLAEVPSKAVLDIRHHRLRLQDYADLATIVWNCFSTLATCFSISFCLYTLLTGQLYFKLGFTVCQHIIGFYSFARSYRLLHLRSLF